MNFDKLYTDYYNQIKATAKSFMKNEEDALDVTQDTFLQAYQSYDQYDDSYSLSTWLTQICINKSRDKLRQRKAERKRILPLTTQSEKIMESQEDTATPDSIMSAEEDMVNIFSSFTQLPANIAEAVKLRLVDDYSYKEIAEEMGIPINTAKTWVRRGRTQILNTIGPQ